jgi:AcrR family transcriptional regulator
MPQRRYDGARRKAQAAQTRALILDAVIAALAKQEELSVPALANAAGVSVPTVYRHFPTREALIDATQEAIGGRFHRPEWPESPDDLGARVAERFAWFEANGIMIRAILSSPLGREVLASVQRRRERVNTRSMQARVSHLEETRARAVIAIVSMLDDAHTWRQLRDAWRIRAEDATWAARWAMQTLLGQLAADSGSRRMPARNKRRS